MDHIKLRIVQTALAPLLLLFLFTLVLSGQDQRPGRNDETTPQTLKNLSLEELSKIELTTVSKESTDAFRTPTAISVLTRQDIARSGASNIPDLLRLLPGVEVAQISSDKWAIGIRGFQGLLSKSVLVLIDGRSVYTPLFAGVYWEMQDTLVEDIERIEVIRGPGGTIWGANAVNGVINIITRNAMDTRGSLVSASGGNVDQGSLGLRYGDRKNNLAYRFWGKGFIRGPQYHPDGGNFDDWRRGQAGFRMDWTPTTRDSITVSGGGYGMVAGSRIGISTYAPPALVNLEGNADMFGQDVELGWRRSLHSESDIQVRAYFDRTDRRDLNYREIRDTVDFDFIHHIARGANEFIWGGGVHTSPSRFIQKAPSVEFFPAKETYSIFSGFAQDSISLFSNRLTATAGSKLEHNSYSGFEAQPSVRLAWTPNAKQTIWAAATRAVRTPSRLEQGFHFTALAVPSMPLYLRLIGDGQFNSEQLMGYELGYRAYVAKRGFISVNGFYNRYDNLLSVESQPAAAEATPEPTHQVLPLFLRNGIAAETKGVEVSTLWDARAWWRLKGSYSYLHLNASRIAGSNDASSEKQLEGDSPQHKVIVQSLFTFPRVFDLDLTFRHVSSIPDQKIPSYSTGGVRIARKIGHEFELSVSGRNLLQPHHPEYGGLPGGIVQVRRSVWLKLAWTR